MHCPLNNLPEFKNSENFYLLSISNIVGNEIQQPFGMLYVSCVAHKLFLFVVSLKVFVQSRDPIL